MAETGRQGALVVACDDNSPLVDGLTAAIRGEPAALERRRFPDGESYLRMDTDPRGRDVAVVASLCPPDPELFAVLALGDALRELGARRVMLVAPYLPYMRQDVRFRAGEAVSSRTFARLISSAYDGLLTVDPHLHRYTTLDEIFSIPCEICRSAASLATWIGNQVDRPVLIGPDEESEQWVATVAEPIRAPWTVLSKVRHGDRDVDIRIPEVARYLERTPILVDDIISTGTTMAAAVAQLRGAGFRAPHCLGIHAVFAEGARSALEKAGAEQIVTTNTLPHATNGIDLAEPLADSLRRLLRLA
ncbi:MAG: ribose-phosphate diphosphokinase [Xanthomonadales bacterium]|nr:ribose-phosphate diphosphokinase [Xanthomonadales bacterium]